MKAPKYSFVIPAYNCKMYLEECVSSALSQTISDFEIIIVDDNSTDGTSELCDRLAQQDPRIKVSHTNTNHGPSYARNQGILNSTGEYVWFVDSDDRISDSGALERLDKILQEYPQVDEMFFLYDAYEDGFAVHLKQQTPMRIEGFIEKTGESLLLELLQKQDILSASTSPVNKLFKKALLLENNIQFPEECRCHEEDEFLCKVVFHGKCFYFLNEVEYYVRTRTDSISTASSEQRIADRFLYRTRVTLRSCEYYEQNSKNREFLEAIYKYYGYYFLCGIDTIKEVKGDKQKKQLKNILRENKKIFCFLKKTNSKYLRIATVIYSVFGINGLKKLRGV